MSDDDLFGSDLEIEYQAPAKAEPAAAADDDLFGSDDEPMSSAPAPTTSRAPTRALGPSRVLRRKQDPIRIGGTGKEIVVFRSPRTSFALF
jgi:hypothetical protein